MKRICFLLLQVGLLHSAHSQKMEWELQLGTLGYAGDLTQSTPSIHSLGPAAGLIVHYRLHPQVSIRAGLTYGTAGAHDKYNKDTLLQRRNLSFRTAIAEGHLGVEVNLIDPADSKVYPYVFAGVGVYHFNPYAMDDGDEKVFLKPLSTEGQGLPEYPDRKEYNLTQLSLPFGGGLKMKVNERFSVGFEIGIRKTFTDYLDDVSTRYINYNILDARRGPKAVELAFRGITPAGVQAEPVTDDIRGNPKEKDVYYYMGFKLIFRKGPSKKTTEK